MMLSFELRAFLGALLICLFSLFSYSAEYGKNLIVNGGAELTPLGENGWITVAGKWGTRDFEPAAKEGHRYFFAKDSSGTAVLSQTIDIREYAKTIETGVQHFQVNSFMAGWNNNDRPHQVYTFLDTQGETLAYFTSPVFKSNQVWRSYSNVIKAPKGAVSLKVSLKSFRRFGLNNDGYHDDIRVVALNPENYHSRELLFNGGAEMDPARYGWIEEAGRWGVDTEDPGPRQGNAYFSCLNTYGSLYQNIDVSDFSKSIDAGIQEFHYQGYHAGSNSSDRSQVTVEYRGETDAEGVSEILDSYVTGTVKTSQKWVKREDLRVAPKGTRTIRIRLQAWRGGGFGNNKNDGHMDALSLVYLPVDVDGDGIPNVREKEWGFNFEDAADGLLDWDNDGFTNLQEYELGTNPKDADDIPILQVKVFYANKSRTHTNDSEPTLLNWEVSGSESMQIYQTPLIKEESDGSVKEVFGKAELIHSETFLGDRINSGSIAVNPEVSTSYQLIAYGLSGRATASAFIEFAEPVEYPEWPEVLTENDDFIPGSITILSDGSHFVARKDESYNYYEEDESGKKMLEWKLNGLGMIQNKATLINGMAIVSTSLVHRSKGKIVAINYTGDIVWEFETDAPIKARTISDSKGVILFAVGYYGKIHALDALTGRLLWDHQIPEDDLIVLNAPALKEEKTAEGHFDPEKSMLLIRTTDNRVFAYKTNGQAESQIWKNSIQ